jgi:secretion/DNA translocation related TadE-like protein
MTVVMVGVVFASLLLLTACLEIASAVIALHRARAAADLGALAAASELQQGAAPGAACARAEAVVRRNGASQAECLPSGDGAVEVAATTHWGATWPRSGVATGRARAGPAEAARAGFSRGP